MCALIPRPVHADHGGGSFEEFGLDFSRLDRIGAVVDADVLDAWYAPSPVAVTAIEENLAWLLRRSPPTHAEGLRRTIAQVRGLPEECLVLGGGTSALLYAALPRLVRPGDRPLVLDPAYGEYSHWFEAVEGIRCARHVLVPERDYDIDADEYMRQLGSADIVVLVNPNSPTGRAAPRDLIRAILDALPRFGWLVVDETYSDFAEQDASVETWVEREPKLVVLKSLSKYWALSGVRAGYLAAHPDLVRTLRPTCPPWSIGLVAQLAAVEALRDAGYYAAMAARTRELRSDLAAGLNGIGGLRAIPSQANFLLLELEPDGPSSRELTARTREVGVYLRDCDSQSAHGTGRLVRTAVKDAASNSRIVEAVRRAVGR